MPSVWLEVWCDVSRIWIHRTCELLAIDSPAITITDVVVQIPSKKLLNEERKKQLLVGLHNGAVIAHAVGKLTNMGALKSRAGGNLRSPSEAYWPTDSGCFIFSA